MARIEAGEFLIGTPEGVSQRAADESPVTKVHLSRGFWMGRCEVTRREWAECKGASAGDAEHDGDVPVTGVSWLDAMDYGARLTEKERRAGRLNTAWEYRFPNEAEWEYVRRLGGKGSAELCALRSPSFRWQSRPPAGFGVSRAEGQNEGPAPVGFSLPNPWGFHDLEGNVWEWCLDWYQPALPVGEVSDPQGPRAGTMRVLRGGSWRSRAESLRSECRTRNLPTTREEHVGFRVVLAPVAGKEK